MDPGKSKSRILHVITGLLGGGAERFTIDLVKAQLAAGKQAQIVSLGNETETLVAEVRAQHISLELLDMSRNPFHVFASVRKLREIIGHFAPDVIHCHMFHPMFLAVWAVANRNPRPAIVFTPHSFNIGSRLREFITALTRPWRSADVLFSKSMIRYFYRKDAVFIPNGIFMEPFSDVEKQARFTFINVAGLRPEKNQITILRAVEQLRNAGMNDFDVWIAGDGPLKESLVQYKDRRRLDNVHFLGFRKDIGKLLQQAHCFILPSLWEGLPLSVLEAASFAVPVICTRVGGLEEYFDENEFLYTGMDATDLAAAMANVLQYPEKYFRTAFALKKRVRNDFSMQAVELKYDRVYRDYEK